MHNTQTSKFCPLARCYISSNFINIKNSYNKCIYKYIHASFCINNPHLRNNNHILIKSFTLLRLSCSFTFVNVVISNFFQVRLLVAITLCLLSKLYTLFYRWKPMLCLVSLLLSKIWEQSGNPPKKMEIYNDVTWKHMFCFLFKLVSYCKSISIQRKLKWPIIFGDRLDS